MTDDGIWPHCTLTNDLEFHWGDPQRDDVMLEVELTALPFA